MARGKLGDVDLLGELRSGLTPREISKLHSVDPAAVTRKVNKLSGLNPSQYRSKCIAEDFKNGMTEEELSSKYRLGYRAVREHINKGGVYLW